MSKKPTVTIERTFKALRHFIPGVKPYEATTVVEFSPVAGGTRLLVIDEAMHDAQWTKLAAMGWESQLNKLTAALA